MDIEFAPQFRLEDMTCSELHAEFYVLRREHTKNLVFSGCATVLSVIFYILGIVTVFRTLFLAEFPLWCILVAMVSLYGGYHAQRTARGISQENWKRIDRMGEIVGRLELFCENCTQHENEELCHRIGDRKGSEQT
jgi:hypothetical protein